MTAKKRRQRGTRTHGGGSHKNGRGAGHRGGRGDAGRDKHEFHNHTELGKHGFTRPEHLQQEAAVVNLKTISEHVFYNDVERVYARDLIDHPEHSDYVKVLGSGEFREGIEVVADQFADSAVKSIEKVGGSVIHTEEVSEIEKPDEDNKPMSTENGDVLEKVRKKADEGEEVSLDDFNRALEKAKQTGQIEENYDVLVTGVENNSQLSADYVVSLYRLQSIASDLDVNISRIDNILDSCFGEKRLRGRKEELQQGVDESISIGEIEDGIKSLEEEWEAQLSDDYSPIDDGLEEMKRDYLLSVRDSVDPSSA